MRAERLHMPTFDEVVAVVLDGVFAWRFDQQATDVDELVGQQAPVLHEARTVTVEDKCRRNWSGPFA